MPSDAFTDLGLLEEAPAYLIYRVARLMRFHLKGFLQEVGLDVSPEQYFLLYRLMRADADPVSQADLADDMLGDYPNITRLIDGLEKKGLVVRQPDPGDRRKHHILLTHQGKSQMNAVAPQIAEERARLFGALSAEDAEAFRRTLFTLQERIVQRVSV